MDKEFNKSPTLFCLLRSYVDFSVRCSVCELLPALFIARAFSPWAKRRRRAAAAAAQQRTRARRSLAAATLVYYLEFQSRGQLHTFQSTHFKLAWCSFPQYTDEKMLYLQLLVYCCGWLLFVYSICSASLFFRHTHTLCPFAFYFYIILHCLWPGSGFEGGEGKRRRQLPRVAWSLIDVSHDKPSIFFSYVCRARGTARTCRMWKCQTLLTAIRSSCQPTTTTKGNHHRDRDPPRRDPDRQSWTKIFTGVSWKLRSVRARSWYIIYAWCT